MLATSNLLTLFVCDPCLCVCAFVHPCIINIIFLTKFSRNLGTFVANIRFIMDFGRKKTQKYTFKSPKLEDLRRLGSLVVDTEAFSKRYGHLLSLLKINMEDGLFSTLIQFYDPVYHCFTFPDYQLMPTLEEYSHLIGVPISSQAPFFGL